ncbi:MAG: DUF6242 domain-containing protein [Paludibacteraceae bacterium]|nr:DUF6242 domain-containing protein [Paludibacteraceae bacterium]
MKHQVFKSVLYSMIAMTTLFASCGDEEDTTLAYKNLDDPRIRSMRINNITSDFVVNDLDQIIYNYDSLNVGTDLTNAITRFYGYTSTPTVQVKRGDQWVLFKNGSPINFNQPVEILCTSEDGSNQKKYTIEVRVHNYDVAALTWHKMGTIDNNNKVVSQQSCTFNKKKLWFFADEAGASHLMSSSDLKQWTETSLNIVNANWGSSAILGDSIYVQNTTGEVYAADLNTLTFSPFTSTVKIEKILFTIGDKIWAISQEGEGFALYTKAAGDFQKKSLLPSDFPTENLISFTSTSGYTSLGYIYATQNGNGTVWSIDSKGNARVLQQADGTIPALTNPILFQYENMLGIVGGELADGTHSTLCYSSQNCGASWSHDWHKDLNGENATLSQPGVFVLSQEGEIVFVGGNTTTGVSNIIWKGVLNKLTADDLNYQN